MGSDLESYASLVRRMVAADYFDKTIFAWPGGNLMYWNEDLASASASGGPTAVPVPGLPISDHYWGVCSFGAYLILWTTDRLKWNASNDFSTWIPVGESAATLLAKTVNAFSIPDDDLTESGWIFVDQSVAGMVAGQYVRVDSVSPASPSPNSPSAPNVTFFEVTDVAPVSDMVGAIAAADQHFPVNTSTPLFLTTYIPYQKGNFLKLGTFSNVFSVDVDAVMPPAGFLVLAGGINVGLNAVPGQTQVNNIPVTTVPVIQPGSFVSIGNTTTPGRDVYLVNNVDLLMMTISLTWMGVPAMTSGVHSAGEFVVAQPYVYVTNTGPNQIDPSQGTAVSDMYALKVKRVLLTGAESNQTQYPTGTQIETVDANDAGEIINAGGGASGAILRVETVGSYAYIFKNRSIQSMQPVGMDQGTFYIRTEVSDEGFIGRYSFVKVGLDKLYFWGNKEIYVFGGGNHIVPIAQQFTKQMFAELDTSRVDEIVGYHNAKSSEIWFVYPVLGASLSSSRVFIYNYLENSCTVDDYDNISLTAAGSVGIVTGVTWDEMRGAWNAPETWAQDARWVDLQEGSGFAPTTIGYVGEDGSFQIAIFGDTQDRDGEAYTSTFETIDFDNGDPVAVKYADTIQISFQIKVAAKLDYSSKPIPQYLNLQVGSRMNLDDDISWSNAHSIQVQGNGNYVTRVNIRKGGRFLRVRFQSETNGFEWRISQFKVMGRMGGTY